MEKGLDKEKAISTAITSIEKQFGRGSIMRLGEAQGMVHLPELSDLAHAQRLQFREVTSVGDDVRILARLV